MVKLSPSALLFVIRLVGLVGTYLSGLSGLFSSVFRIKNHFRRFYRAKYRFKDKELV